MVASAHVGSPNVVFDGNAGPYPIRVVVRPPQVVPGLADVVIRSDAEDVTRVAIRPVFWRAGVKGAPTPDDAVRVQAAGKTAVFTGRLWLMAYGSYSVYVTVDGARGSGTAIVPVASFATGRLGIPVPLAGVLVVLALLLVAGLVTIVRAAAGDSLLPAGQLLDAAGRRRANIATAVAVPVVAVVIFGGARWWNAEDQTYQRRMYRPPAADPEITVDSTHRTLTLRVHDTAQFRAIFAPIVPDHGKMMHLFLVSTSGMQVFAHLHPVETDSLRFTGQLPWIPAGRYLMFGDIATENGLSLTVSNRLEVPPAPGLVSPSDPDDSWDRTTRVTTGGPGAIRPLGGGYQIVWEGRESPLVSGQSTDLKFVVWDSAMKPVPLKPYLGMAGHAVVVRHDASVFIHLHPMGTIAPVTQTVFAARDRGDTTANGRLRPLAAAAEHTGMTFASELSFPYEFPKPGRYRIWVQVKPADQVLTGTFDIDVR
ncbi:MAG: hypothetical protein ACREBE_03800 [bacterium]